MLESAGVNVIKEFRSKPELFESYFFKTKCWEKQYDIWRSVMRWPRTTVKSAFGCGKSFVAARICLWWFFSYPDAIVICTAPTYKLCAAILFREIYSQFKEIPFPTGVKIYETLMLKDPLEPDHFIMGYTSEKKSQADESLGSRFQGLHSKHLLLCLDEAAGLDDSVFEGALTMCTNPESRILAIGNAISMDGYFYNTFLSGPPDSSNGWNKLSISALQTPNVLAGKVVNPNLPSKEWVEFMKAEYGEESPEYLAKVLSVFPEASKDILFSHKSVDNAMNRDAKDIDPEKLEGFKDICVLGVDPSGEGQDYTTAYLLKDVECKQIVYQQRISNEALVAKLDETIRENKVTSTAVDADGGYGSACIQSLKKLGHKVVPYHSAGAAMQWNRFADKRTECAFAFKSRLEEKTICLSKDDDLKRQISKVKTEMVLKSGQGVNKLKPKSDEKLLLNGHSPDKLDAILIAFSNLARRKRLFSMVLDTNSEENDDWDM